MKTCYETERLLVKVLDPASAPMVLSFYEDNKHHFEPWEPKRSHNFYTIAYQKASLTAEFNQITDGKLLRFWVLIKDNPQEIIGSICFQNFLKAPYQSCVLGYKFSHRCLHRGYAFESIQKCIKLVFDELQIHRIEAMIMPHNAPSIRLAEHLSFHKEGLAQSYALVDGQWCDHIRYTLINPKDSFPSFPCIRPNPTL